jgi:pyruvate formate lyase activating enzyme
VERGERNLAVFYRACTFDCLGCQNWHFRLPGGLWTLPKDLANRVDAATTCLCFFGGDPGPHLGHALRASRIALSRARARGRILRVCFETNGCLSERHFDSLLDVVLSSGGMIKFDIKAYSDPLHQALTGSSSRMTLDFLRRSAERMIPRRPNPPPVLASTLLVPGYVDAREVGRIARFVSSLDPQIPYAILAFHPAFLLSDLGSTTRDEARDALEAAREAGLTRIHVGNIAL